MKESRLGIGDYKMGFKTEKYVFLHIHVSAESFKKGWCQLQAKVCARSTG